MHRISIPLALLASASLSVAPPLTPPASAQEVPVVTLSGPAATYPDGLGSLRGVRQLSGGRLLVADGLGQALIVWTPGAGADTLTNIGEGPDEYENPDGLFPLPDGGTLLVDIGNARLVELDANLEFGDTRPIARGQTGPGMTLLLPAATDDGGFIYFHRAEIGVEGGMRDSASVARFDRQSEDIVDLARIKIQDTKRQESGSGNNRNISIEPIPLSPQDAWGVAPDGSLAVARSSDYHIEWIRPDGRIVRGPAVAYEPVRVGTAEQEEYFEDRSGGIMIDMEMSDGGSPRMSMSRGSSEAANMRRDIARYEWPDVKPAFTPRAVTVSPAGHAWVRRSRPAGEPTLFDIFDSEGIRLAQVALPPDRQLVGFGDDAVFLVRSDELEFAWLEVYELPMERLESGR
jgi:hypothetical protein